LATGLLALLVGETTRATERLHTAPKVYDALVRFGSETATDDREGEPTRSAAPPAAASSIEAGLAPLRGAIWQVPPAYAAVKVGGRPAYARARSGETVKLAAREVQVHRLEMTEWNPPDARLFIVCGSGTYVRSIARDLGRALGSAAHLAALRRLAAGRDPHSSRAGGRRPGRWGGAGTRARARRPAARTPRHSTSPRVPHGGEQTLVAPARGGRENRPTFIKRADVVDARALIG